MPASNIPGWQDLRGPALCLRKWGLGVSGGRNLPALHGWAGGWGGWGGGEVGVGVGGAGGGLCSAPGWAGGPGAEVRAQLLVPRG